MAIPKFDWSSLNRYELTEYVWSVYPKLINKELTVEKFHRTLGNHIKHNIPIKLKKLRDKKVENNCVCTSFVWLVRVRISVCVRSVVCACSCMRCAAWETVCLRRRRGLRRRRWWCPRPRRRATSCSTAPSGSPTAPSPHAATRGASTRSGE